MIKILHLIISLDFGGTETMLYHFLKHSDKTKFKHRIICLRNKGWTGKEIEKLGIQVDYLKKGNKKFFYDYIIDCYRIRKIISEYQPQIMQSYLIHSNFLSRIICFFDRKYKIINTYKSSDDWRGFFLNSIDKLTSFRTDKFIANSIAVKNFLTDKVKINPDKIEIIYSGIDIENIVPTDFTKNNYFVCISRLHYEKGIDILLNLYKKIIEKNKNVPDLIIAGDGPEREQIQKLISNYNLKSRVILIGFQQKPFNLLKQARLFILTSRWEGFPAAILEAMAAKIPVIASRINGITELVIDDETGILIDINNIEESADKIISKIKDTVFLKKISEAAYNKVKQNFTLKRMVMEIENVYNKII